MVVYRSIPNMKSFWLGGEQFVPVIKIKYYLINFQGDSLIRDRIVNNQLYLTEFFNLTYG